MAIRDPRPHLQPVDTAPTDDIAPRTAARDAATSASRVTADLVRRTMIMALVTRLGILAVAGLSTYVLATHQAPWSLRLQRQAEPFSGAGARFFNIWAHWDGVWYIKIASYGYAGADGTAAFFPLYPLIVRWVGVPLGNNLVAAGVLVSVVTYLVGVYLLYRLVELDFGPRIAYRTAWFLSIFPTAFFFQAVYSESLFLMLSTACLLWSRQGRWRRAGLAGLLATLTRSTGFMLLVPMVIFYLEQRDWKWRRLDSDAASLLMIPEGLMVWMAYLSLGFGKPLLFASAQDNWRRVLAVPTWGLWRGILAAVQGARQLLSGQTRHVYWPAPNSGSVMSMAGFNITNLGFTVVALLAIWHGLRRLPPAYSAYAIATIGYPLLFPSRFQPLMSMPRFILAAFPIFISLALFTDRRPRWHAAISLIFIAMLVVVTARFAIFTWVA